MTTDGKAEGLGWRTITAFVLPGTRGSEHEAMERVAEAVRELRLPVARLEQLKTAVAEAVLNAVEHGSHIQPTLSVQIRVSVPDARGVGGVRLTDHGRGAMPASQAPNRRVSFEGRQTGRGWGFFLIEKIVDRARVASDETCHTIELILYQEGDQRRPEYV